jgi:type II secretory pathway component PulJ
MKKLLKFLLSSKFKTQKQPQKKGGFTLIELLVGLALAFLIITPLLGFVVNTMTSDRQEQAKSASEQEIQTALDYISRDASQALFIYDGYGVQRLVSNNALPRPAGDSTPVLVFWKREIKPKVLPNKDDAFVLSLVAYYLIKDTACNSTSAWSCTARIGRVQMDEAVPDPTDSTRQPIVEATPRGFTTPLASATTITTNPAAPVKTLAQRMNEWQPTGADLGSVKEQILLDYIDQTTLASNLSPPITPCSTAPRPDRPDLANPSPTDIASEYPYRQTPTTLQTNSFYACVDVSSDTTPPLAQVFIRGNSLARIRPKNNAPTYVASQSAYFPKASVQIQGRGLIGQD